jgi:hypothetical protein
VTISGPLQEAAMRSPWGSQELLDVVETICDTIDEGGAAYDELDQLLGNHAAVNQAENDRQWLAPLPSDFATRLEEYTVQDDIINALASLEAADEETLSEALTTARARVVLLENLLKAHKRNNANEGQPGRLLELLLYLDGSGPKLPKDIGEDLQVTAGAVSSCICSHRTLFVNKGKGWSLTPAGKERLKELTDLPPVR